MTVNEKKVLANIESLAQWLEEYQQNSFGLSGDLVGKNPDLADYFFHFHCEFNNFERSAKESELMNEIGKSEIIFLGDNHNLRASQKYTAELIKKSSFGCTSPKNEILAVEFVYADCQKYLDAYQSDSLSEQNFLKKINFKDWNSPDHWQGYKAILATAKKCRIRVCAIRNRQQSYNQTEKDKLLAGNLRIISEFYPADRWYIHIGDAHLAQNHLPEKMLAFPEFSGKKMIRIMGNISEIYFTALRRYKNFKLPQILKIKSGVYHVMTAPILTKLISNIENLEYTVNKENGDTIALEVDLTFEVVQRWSDLLKLGFNPERLPDFYIGEGMEKEFRLKRILEELARSVFGGSDSFAYFCSKLFIPERRPENKKERAGERMFINFLSGKKPVIPRI